MASENTVSLNVFEILLFESRSAFSPTHGVKRKSYVFSKKKENKKTKFLLKLLETWLWYYGRKFRIHLTY